MLKEISHKVSEQFNSENEKEFSNLSWLDFFPVNE